MSVLEAATIDMWGIPKWDQSKVVLGISDHVGWEQEQEGEHLLLLQEKLNTYIAFIESGEINETIPSAQGKAPIIRITGKYPLSEQAELFIDQATETLKEAGIELEFVLKPR